MISFDKYTKQVKFLASIKNFIYKFRVAFIIAGATILVLLTSFTFSKGAIIGEVTMSNVSYTYGDNITYEEVTSLFSDTNYEFYMLVDDSWVKVDNPTKPGTYGIRAVSKKSFGKSNESELVQFEITKKEIQITIDNTNIDFGSKPTSYTISDSLIGDDSFNDKDITYADVTCNNTLAVIDLDDADNDGHKMQIVNANNEDVTDYYNLVLVNPNVTFNKREITIKSKASSFVYSNTPNSYEEYEIISDTKLLEGDEIKVVSSTKITDVGTTPNILEYKILRNNLDVSANYNITKETSNLEVTKKDATISGLNLNEVFNGFIEYSTISSNEALEETGLLEEHKAYLTYTSSLNQVGNIDNEFTCIIKENDKDVTDNYNITSIFNKLIVSPREITISNIKANDKTYDSTTNVTLDLSAVIFDNVVLDDNDIALEVDGIFEDKNAGDSKKILLSNFRLSGTYADNYVVSENTITEIYAQIEKKKINVNSINVLNKEYDKTNSLTYDYSNVIFDGLCENDNLAVNATGYFDDVNVNENIHITTTSVELTGIDKDNYIIESYTVSDKANITPRIVVVSGIKANDKVYDGNTTATLDYEEVIFDRKIDTDNISIEAIGTFENKNANENKKVALTNLVITGVDASNYVLNEDNQQVEAIATINPKEVTVSLDVTGLIYGETNQTTYTLTGNLEDETVDVYLNYLGTSNDGLDYNEESNPNKAGNYKVVATITDTNYSLPLTEKEFTIARKEVVVSNIEVNDKTYDGNKTSTLDYSHVVIDGSIDDIYVNAVGTFIDKNVGIDKKVYISNIEILGDDKDNYVLASSGQQYEATASITQREVTISNIKANDKEYDQTTNVVFDYTNVIIENMIENDDLLVVVTGSFIDKNVEEDKIITFDTIELTGIDKDNYYISMSSQNYAIATINAKKVIISGIGVDNKVYDQETIATFNYTNIVFSGLIEGDDLSLIATGSFKDKNVEKDKKVDFDSLELEGLDKDNYYIDFESSQKYATASITKKKVIISGIEVEDKEYDKTNNVTFNYDNVVINGYIAGDDLSVIATGYFDDVNVNNNVHVTITNNELDGVDKDNYQIDTYQEEAYANITPRIVVVSGIKANDKVYDGNTTATLDYTEAVFDRKIDSDTISIQAIGTFNNKNVGTNKVVYLSDLEIIGADASNYVLNEEGQQTTANASISQLEVYFDGITIDDKEYDGNIIANPNYGALVIHDSILGDDVSVEITATYDNKNVGVDKQVTFTSYELVGDDATNYVLASGGNQTSSVGTIYAREIIVSNIQVQDKEYDKTDEVEFFYGEINIDRFIEGDDVSFVCEGHFDDVNAGTNKRVSITKIAIEGSDKNNYTLSVTGNQEETYATITPRIVVVSGIKANDKVYDGNTTATLDYTEAVFDRKIDSDTISIQAIGTFDNKNVGTNKVVYLSDLEIIGTDASNYVLKDEDQQEETTSSITIKSVSITGIEVEDKEYDKTNNVTFNYDNVVINGYIAGDDLSVIATGYFDDVNVNNNVHVTITNNELDGVDKDNYQIDTYQEEAYANITPRIVVVSGIKANDKVYDGNTTATLDYTEAVFDRKIDSDTISIQAIGTFDNKNVGTNKVVSLTDLEIIGTDASNYVLNEENQQTTANASITKLEVTVSGITTNDRTYNRKTSIESSTFNVESVIITTMITGDDLSVEVTGHMLDKNVGTNKKVLIDSIKFIGVDKGNYLLSDSGNQEETTVNVTPKEVNIADIEANEKEYDKTNTVTFNYDNVTIDGLISGDNLSVEATGYFDDVNVAYDTNNNIIDVSVTIDSNTLTGTDKDNYTIVEECTSTSAKINPKKVTVSGIKANGKIYDGTTTAVAYFTDVLIQTIIAGDTVNVSSSSATFENKNVGTNKLVSFSDVILDNTNYIIDPEATIPTSTATITKKDVSVSNIEVMEKEYDKTNSVTFTYDNVVITGKIDNDDLLVEATGHFNDVNAGTDKEVTIDNVILTGTDKDNYNLVSFDTTAYGTITKRELIVSNITANDKVYDGTVNAILVYSMATFDRVISGDTIIVESATGEFEDKNVGTNKKVTISNIVLGGTSIDNYQLKDANQEIETTASITPKNIKILSGIQANTKEYDKTNDVTFDCDDANIDGLVEGDELTVNATGYFDDVNVAYDSSDNIIAVSVTISEVTISGNDSNNYTLTEYQTASSAIIYRREVIVSGIVANDKVYDGNDSATFDYTDVAFDRLITGDSLTVEATGKFINKDVLLNASGIEQDKDVIITKLTLGGTSLSNYTLKEFGQQESTKAKITQKSLSVVSGIEGKTREYDKTTLADNDMFDTTNVVYNGLVVGEKVEIEVTGHFDDYNVGTNKKITIDDVVILSDNYKYDSENSQSETTGSISPRTIYVESGTTASDKVYDGTTSATLDTTNSILADVIDGDVVNVSAATGHFESKDVSYDWTGAMVQKQVIVDSYTIGGTDASNYQVSLLTGQTSTYASITPLTVTVKGIVAEDKAYDGNTSVTLNCSGAEFYNNNKIPGDNLLVTATGCFDSAEVAYDEEGNFDYVDVTITGISLTGTDKGNYVLASSGNQSKTKAKIYTGANEFVDIGINIPGYNSWEYGDTTNKFPYAELKFGDASNVEYYYEGTLSNGTIYNRSKTQPTQAGSYDLIGYLPASGSYSEIYSDPFAFTITKKEVDVPIISSKQYVKDTIQIADIYSTAYYTVYENNGGIDVGRYDVILDLVDSNNSYFEGYAESISRITLDFYIKKISLTNIYASAKVYNGLTQYADIEEQDYYSISGNDGFVAIGDYPITITITDTTNYEWRSDSSNPVWSFTFRIVSKLVDLPEYTHSFVYNGNVQTPTIATSSDYDIIYTNPNSTDAGLYTISLKLTDSNAGWNNNYYEHYENENSGLHKAVVYYRITKCEVEVPTVDPKLYTGHRQYSGLEETSLYYVYDDGGINPGTFQARLTLKDPTNYYFANHPVTDSSIYVSYEIVANFDRKVTVYNTSDSASTPIVDRLGFTYTVEGGISNSINYSGQSYAGTFYNSDEMPTDPGRYKVTIFPNNSMYSFVYYDEYNNPLDEDDLYYTVYKIEISAPDDTIVTYDGLAHTTNYVESDYYTVENATGIDAGRYDVVLTLKNPSIYKFEGCNDYETTKSIYLVINKKALYVSGISVYDKEYDGTNVATFDYSNVAYDGIVGDDDVYVNGVSGFFYDKNVGTDKPVYLTPTLDGEDKDNYEINYNSITTASITKKALTISSLMVQDATFISPTTSPIDDPTFIVSGYVESDIDDLQLYALYTGTQNSGTSYNSSSKPTYSGSYSATIKTNNNNYSINKNSAAFTINKSKVSYPTSVDSKVYNGYRQYADVDEGENYYVLTNAGGINAGNYSVVLSVSYPNDSYFQVDTHKQTTVELVFTITKKVVTVSSIKANDKYYDTTSDVISFDCSNATISGKIAKDDLNVSSASGYFVDEDGNPSKDVYYVGSVVSAKNVVITDIQFGGSSLKNYTVDLENSPLSSTGKILPYVLSGVKLEDITIEVEQTLEDVSYSVKGLNDEPIDVIIKYTGTSNDGHTYNNSTEIPAYAGIYTMSGTPNDTNYIISSISNGTLTIIKKKIDTPDSSLFAKPYNGKWQYATVTSPYYVAAYNPGGKNKGTYALTLRISDTYNYEWRDSTSNTISSEFKIEAILIDVKFENESNGNNGNFIYDGNDHISSIVPYFLDLNKNKVYLQLTSDSPTQMINYQKDGYEFKVEFINSSPIYAIPEDYSKTFYIQQILHVALGDYEKEYDGMAMVMPSNNYEVISGTLESGDEIRINSTTQDSAISTMVERGNIYAFISSCSVIGNSYRYHVVYQYQEQYKFLIDENTYCDANDYRGKISITRRTVTVKVSYLAGTQYVFDYDDQNHSISASNIRFTSQGLLSGHELVISSTPNVKKASDDIYKVGFKVMSGSTDVSSSYKITYAEDSATMVINPLDVTIYINNKTISVVGLLNSSTTASINMYINGVYYSKDNEPENPITISNSSPYSQSAYITSYTIVDQEIDIKIKQGTRTVTSNYTITIIDTRTI